MIKISKLPLVLPKATYIAGAPLIPRMTHDWAWCVQQHLIWSPWGHIAMDFLRPFPAPAEPFIQRLCC
jgi:hypothetical protein